MYRYRRLGELRFTHLAGQFTVLGLPRGGWQALMSTWRHVWKHGFVYFVKK
jgi:hypothetical protein